MQSTLKINWPKQIYYAFAPIVLGITVGKWLQRMEDERMTRFRDKSALYGRVLAPGEKPTWP